MAFKGQRLKYTLPKQVFNLKQANVGLDRDSKDKLSVALSQARD